MEERVQGEKGGDRRREKERGRGGGEEVIALQHHESNWGIEGGFH